MKGILVVSHGNMARGVADTARYILGKSIEQFDYCCLDYDVSVESYGKQVRQKIRELDTGEGVIVLADFYGGSSSSVVLPLLADSCDMITGFNFPILMEILMARMYCDIDISEIIRKGKEGIKDARDEIVKDYVSEE